MTKLKDAGRYFSASGKLLVALGAIEKPADTDDTADTADTNATAGNSDLGPTCPSAFFGGSLSFAQLYA